MKMSDIMTGDDPPVRLVDHDGPVWVKGGGHPIFQWSVCRELDGYVRIESKQSGSVMVRVYQPSEIFTTREGAMQ